MRNCSTKPRIEIWTYSNWHIFIRPDGSARYGFGDGDSMSLPTGTFSYETLIETLEKSLVEKRSINSACWVVFRMEDQVTAVARYTTDEATIGAIFDTARKTLTAPHFEEFWEKSPPIVRQMTIATFTGWELIIRPDGSGRLKHHETRYEAPIPAGSFSYEQVANDLEKSLMGEEPARKGYWVTFEMDPKRPTGSNYTTNERVSGAIFQKAYELVPLPPQLDEVWEQAPPTSMPSEEQLRTAARRKGRYH